jgi:hypothetical protein
MYFIQEVNEVAMLDSVWAKVKSGSLKTFINERNISLGQKRSSTYWKSGAYRSCSCSRTRQFKIAGDRGGICFSQSRSVKRFIYLWKSISQFK